MSERELDIAEKSHKYTENLPVDVELGGYLYYGHRVRDAWIAGHNSSIQQLDTLTQERDALREENARLRQLVTKLVAGDQMTLAS